MNQKLLVIACIFTAFLLVIYMATTSDKIRYSRSEDFSMAEIRNMRRFKNVIVHLDLKGAPPRIEYIEKVFDLLEKLSVDGVLIEYEDMFPYDGEIEVIKRKYAYSKETITRILELAARRNLEVIPLIQTFGHLEFVLKHEKYQSLSEDLIGLNTICVSDEKSIDVIEEMLKQIKLLHPNSTRIHIGSDEAYHIAEDRRCIDRMHEEELTKSDIKLKHIARIATLANFSGFSEILAWNDMFDKEPEESIKEVKLDKLITPVVWGYATDVTKPGYFPNGLFDRLHNVFDKLYIGSAFKGANGNDQQFLNITRYIENHRSYVKLMEQHPNAAKKAAGIIITGWSRFTHSDPLCELLPVSIPSLVANLIYVNFEPSENRDIWRILKERLNCQIPHMIKEIQSERILETCEFDGVEVFKTITIDWKLIIEKKRTAKFNETELKKDASKILNNLRTYLTPILYQPDIDELCAQLLRDYEKYGNN